MATKSNVGKIAIIISGEHSGKSGIVSYENGGRSVMLEIDGQQESFPIEMTDLYKNELACHYCGMPARKFDIFDAPVCSQCGG